MEVKSLLPIVEKKSQIIEAIARYQVVIICGETGSGKTTQLPQFCREMGRGLMATIGQTQPRRIAAKSVALRISQEMKLTLGQEIGYQIRFEDKTSSHTRLKIMTDGILLAEIQHDKTLRKYDTLIIDEAHERSLNIDVLLGLLKGLLPQRPDLKLIISSATLEVERFQNYFKGAPLVEVSGRTYPVGLRYQPLVEDEKTALSRPEAIQKAILSLRTELPGDILVFLSGEGEIRETEDFLRRHLKDEVEILPLYARLSSSMQNQIFTQAKKLRIILSTNIAETSLTVPGIRYVIDSGVVRMARYDYRTEVQHLPIEPISKASCKQRAGRCGRLGPGICIRLYSEEDFNSRSEFTEPEILRSSLASVVLQLLQVGNKDIEQFPFIEPPNSRFLKEALRLLTQLKAIDEERELTAVGQRLIAFPLEPRLAAILLASEKYRCVQEILVIISGLTASDVREYPQECRAKAEEKHRRFWDESSDFLGVLKLWNYLQETKASHSQNQLKKLCQSEFLSFVRFREWQEIYHQLKTLIVEQGCRLNEVAADSASIHKALLVGLLGHIGFLDEKSSYDGLKNKKFMISQQSSLKNKKPKWIMAYALVETTRIYAHTVGRIMPEWIEEIAGVLIKKSYSEPHWQASSNDVVAFCRGTLYGLTIFEKRKVHYGTIDMNHSREIFIREALVSDLYTSSALFVKHNQNLMSTLYDLERKTRRRDWVISDEKRCQFFNERLPATVHNGRTLEAWLKTVAQTLLCMSLQDILYDDDLKEFDVLYPDLYPVGETLCPLSYCFEPGSDADGLTLTLPLDLESLWPVPAFEWLVPGFLYEKVFFYLKSLPFNLRQICVPLDKMAELITRRLPENKADFKVTVAKLISQEIKMLLTVDSWPAFNFPAHLLMSFRILDVEGKLIYEGKDLEPFLKSRHIEKLSQKQALSAPTEILQWLGKKIPELHHWALQLTGLISKQALLQDLSKTILKALYGEEITRLLQSDELMNNLVQKEKAVRRVVVKLQDWLGPALKNFVICKNKWQLAKNHFKLATQQDIDSQISMLIYPGFIEHTPPPWDQRLALYFQAITLRIEKGPNHAQEPRFLKEVLPFWRKAVVELKKPVILSNPQFQEFRWLLEEFRLSLFAQSLKTLMPISAVRLEKYWQIYLGSV